MTFSHFETNRPDIQLAEALRSAGLKGFDVSRFDRDRDEAQVRVHSTEVSHADQWATYYQAWTPEQAELIIEKAEALGLSLPSWYREMGKHGVFIAFN